MMADRTVLVIDDEPGFGRFVRRVSEQLAFEVRVTTRAAQFKQAYRAFRPRVIVMDVVMPEVDGIELVRWLADQECDSRIIVVTGYNPDYASFASALGSGRGLKDLTTLAKPVSVNDLRAALVGEH